MSDEKTKIKNLVFKSYALKKPLSVAPDGSFLNACDLASQPSLAIGSLHALSEDLQIKLALERNRMEPDFRLGIIGIGLISKAEVLEHIEAQSELGQTFVRAEISYANELVGALAGGPAKKWALIPKAKAERVPSDWKWVPQRWWPFLRSWALFCENTTDQVTTPAAAYRIKHVHPVFKARGFVVKSLDGVNDVRVNFIPIARMKRTVYLSGIGHGSPTTYTGHMGDPILRVGAYDQAEVKGKSIHFLSCQTAKQLGPDTVQKGAKSYCGYFENFTFVWDDQNTPINEQELFWKADSTYDIMMANGATSDVAYKATIAAFNAAMALVPGTAAATWLKWDRDIFRAPAINAVYGDKAAKISPFILLPNSPFMEAEEMFERFGV